jgi:hypothetical protein
MLLVVGCLFVHGLSMTRKWLVHQVSAMAYWFGGRVQLGVGKVGLIPGVKTLV